MVMWPLVLRRLVLFIENMAESRVFPASFGGLSEPYIHPPIITKAVRTACLY